MTRSMVPIFSPSERRTGVPSTLSLAMRLRVSRVSGLVALTSMIALRRKRTSARNVSVGAGVPARRRLARNRGLVPALEGIQNLQESLPMTVRLKRVEDQVIVLTGASSGIGLATAR